MGRPPELIQVWATLHFLPQGSPFCCCESQDHLGLFGECAARINDAVRRRLKLRQDAEVEFVGIAPLVHEGVQFDDLPMQTTSVPIDGDINGRDALGRTPLMRAAMRGYERQVQQLLEAGADVSIPDADGRNVLDIVRQGRVSIAIAWLLENAASGEGVARGGTIR